MERKGIDENGNEYEFTDEGLNYAGQYLSKYQILAGALLLDDYEYAKTMLDTAENFRGEDMCFDELFFAVEWTFIDKFDRGTGPSELKIQAIFKEKFKDIIVDKKHDGKNIPDAWVMEDGVLKPVEVKRDKFNSKALKQLKRYMNVYGCEQGIAVGKECTVTLPSNIRFIAVSEFYEDN